MSPMTGRSHPFRSLARAFSWHRRKLAVVAAVAAVLTGVAAVNPEGPPTLRVVRATTQLAGGSVVRAGDLEVADIVAVDAPVGALSDPGSVIGQRLAASIAEGQVLTGLAMTADRGGRARGQVVAPLRIADADLAQLLRPGELVDVVAADAQSEKAAVVATGVRIVTVPAGSSDQQAQTGALVLVEVDEAEATRIARAAISGTITVIWR